MIYTTFGHKAKSVLFQHQHQLAELNKKQLEQAMQQLQEQLQLNLFQQTHLLQTADKKKASAPLQQLAIQQQQLIQQLQITQRQYLLQQGLSLQGHNPSSGIYTPKSKCLIKNFLIFSSEIDLNVDINRKYCKYMR